MIAHGAVSPAAITTGVVVPRATLGLRHTYGADLEVYDAREYRAGSEDSRVDYVIPVAASTDDGQSPSGG